MNALFAALFVTSSLLVLAISAMSKGKVVMGNHWGLILYGLGTFCWSLKGLMLQSYGLVFISIIQTTCVFIGVLNSVKK